MEPAFAMLLMAAKAVSPWFHPKNEESPPRRPWLVAAGHYTCDVQ